jgi:hypothetical protein
LKRQIFLVLVVLGSYCAHAETSQSYAVLQAINHQERYLLSFSKYRLLSVMFAHKTFYRFQMHESFDRYEASMRQVAIDLKGGENRTLLTRFVDGKKRMKEIMDLRQASDRSELQDFLISNQYVHASIEEVISSKILALSTVQRVLYALSQMEMQLEWLSLKYTAGVYFAEQTPALQKRMQKVIEGFEKNMQMCIEYPYWNAREKAKGEKISAAWQILKRYVSKPNLVMIVDLASRHIGAMIVSLRELHADKQE